MMKRILALTLGTVLAGQMAFAITADEIVADLQAEGYTRVEVRVGPNQIKVEAIRGTDKIERIVDRATGAVLKSESYMADKDENTNPGVSVRQRNRDFVRTSDRGRDDNITARNSRSDDNRGRGSDDDSGDDDRGRGSDDDSGDDDDRGRGSDDGADHDSEDDHGSRDGSDDGDHDSNDDD